MVQLKIPRRLWDYGMIWESKIISRTASGPDGRTGVERVTGDSVDISEWIDFSFYDLVWFWDTPGQDNNPQLGRFLGVAHRIGSALCYWVLKENGHVLARTTVQHVTDDDLRTDSIRQRITEYDERINERLNDQNFIDETPDGDMLKNDIFLEDEDPVRQEDEGPGVELDGHDADSLDQYIGAELLLPKGDKFVRGRVTKRLRGPDGEPIGKYNANPMLNSRKYQVEFQDGSMGEYTANIIAENMFAQVDDEGHQFFFLKEIIDHRKDARAITKDNGFTISKNGNRVPKITTVGWELLVEWKDGSSDWVKLKDIKQSNPIEVAEYALGNDLAEEPAFKWWVSDVMKRRKLFVNKVKSRYWKTTHKFGIRLPHSVEEALAIDRETGTDYWERAIEKEVRNVMSAFEKRPDISVEEARAGKTKLIGYQEIRCHMIFDIKMDGNFTRKARFVAGGHTTETPASVTYASVVSRDSVRIGFLIAALNELDIGSADIGNAYLNAECREKIWTIAGPEFGSDKGTVMIITKALYGLKSSAFAWRCLFKETLEDLGYKDTKADPDVYRRAATKPNGYKYYEYLLVYVDDILCISHAPQETMKVISGIYRLKDDNTGPPSRYLGANVGKYQLPDGREAWSVSSYDYVKSAVKNLEEQLAIEGLKLPSKYDDRPFPSSYRPELDITPMLDDSAATRYMQLIGILRWACELGRIDILAEVSSLATHLCAPREGHLEAVYRIFAYLKKHNRSTMVFDDAEVEIDERMFTKVDWTEFYEEAEEEMPPGMPEPRGKPVHILTFVDANHAGNTVTRRSQTGIIIFVQNAPIMWLSKKQNTVESSTFGSEFNALRVAVEMNKALRYKLRMFGIPIDGPSDILCDNDSVVKNSSLPHSTLQKKHHSINYHLIREAAARGIIRVGKVLGTCNLADLFTKTTIPTPHRRTLISQILY